MSTTLDQTRSWRFPRPLIQDHIEFALLMWGVLLAISYAITASVAYFSTLEVSIWEQSSNAATWYVAAVCGWVCYQMVPMFIANAQTRHTAGIEASLFVAMLAVAATVMIAAGYLIEYVVYGIAGWPREISGSHLFDSHLDVGLIALENLFILIVWSAVGAFIGLAAYRWEGTGWAALLPASILIGISGFGRLDRSGPIEFVFSRIVADIDTPSIWLAALVTIISVAVSVAIGWWALRTMPLRNR